MRLLYSYIKNFSSYEEVSLTLCNQGLTLIQGNTGSGKSTLCDIVPWILFGKTAKNGSVDEVLTWPGDKVTFGRAVIEINDSEINIYRMRAANPKHNDLYWTVSGHDEKNRGKDLLDTQKRINGLLGMDCDLYLSGSYFHEFSQAAQFFSTTAKNRREICEQVVDLSLAVSLQDKITNNIRAAKKQLQEINTKTEVLASNIAMLKNMQKTELTKVSDWDKAHDFDIIKTKELYERFEENRDIKPKSNICPTCKTVLGQTKHIHNNSENPYKAKLEALITQTNPHTGSAKDFSLDIVNKQYDLHDLDVARDKLLEKSGDLAILGDVVEMFRTTLIQSTTVFLEDQTNHMLSTYFDAEIEVSFSATSTDNLLVIIRKDGNICSYAQLSKGQRQLLRLCFGVAIMKAVSNHHSVKFNTLWIDEGLDGLSDALKIKAYRLFQELQIEYENVFVVEHSESLKALFENKYSVALTDHGSFVEKS